jgi:F0F1-type ATP synthase membrane subunit c/vacuolar-type H+-ATPase subunit K
MNRNMMLGFAGLIAVIAPLLFIAATGQSISRNISLVIVFGMCILGPSLALGLLGAASITALGRNPSAAPKILTTMTFALISVMVIAIVAFLIVWQLFSAE